MGKLKKQYGIWTGIAMVIGIVVGSGVFVKAGGVLNSSGGNLKIALLAWTAGGIIMITSAFCFALFATKVTKFNGVVDYVEKATNRRVGYHLAWIMTSLYYPIVASIVSIVASNYFFKLIGVDIKMNEVATLLLAFSLITLFVVINYFSPKISSIFQISSTAVKLIPIIIIVIVGLFAKIIIGGETGIINALNVNGLAPVTNEKLIVNFGEAVKTTAFAYEGWVCATAINAELKDSKRNLPKALVFGTIAILIFYLAYYLSLSAILGNSTTIAEGNNAPLVAFSKFMGGFGKNIFIIFIIISCLGTVNGVTISCCRGMYTMSCRGLGPMPSKFSNINEKCGTSFLSCLWGYACMIIMLIIWYLAMNNTPFFKHLGSMDEIVCAIIYSAYITMYVYIMKNFKDMNVVKRFILPAIATIGSIFFTICGSGIYQLIFNKTTASLIDFLVFLALTVVVLFPSFFFYRKNGKETIQNE